MTTVPRQTAPTPTPARRVWSAVGNVLFAAAVIVAGYFAWPVSLGGCTTLTIVSGESMEPTYYTGDLVVSRCGPVAHGDVIVYHPDGVGDGLNVIHRIVDGNADDGWVVQGDNNDFIDPWNPTAEDIIGHSVLHLPHVGKVASILMSPLTWVWVLVLGAAVLLWPSDEDDTDDSPQDSTEKDPA